MQPLAVTCLDYQHGRGFNVTAEQQQGRFYSICTSYLFLSDMKSWAKMQTKKNLLWVLHSQWFSLIYFYVSLIFIFVYFPAACLSSAFDLNLRNFRTHLEPRLLRQISQNLLSTFALLTFTLALLFHNRIKRMMSRFWLWLELSNWRHTEAPPSFQSVTQLDA